VNGMNDPSKRSDPALLASKHGYACTTAAPSYLTALPVLQSSPAQDRDARIAALNRAGDQ
jgi:hypothetical protein